jgi:hypothetical protein
MHRSRPRLRQKGNRGGKASPDLAESIGMLRSPATIQKRDCRNRTEEDSGFFNFFIERKRDYEQGYKEGVQAFRSRNMCSREH